MNRLEAVRRDDRNLSLRVLERLEYPLGVLRLLNDTNLFSETLTYAIQDMEALIGEAAELLKK